MASVGIPVPWMSRPAGEGYTSSNDLYRYTLMRIPDGGTLAVAWRTTINTPPYLKSTATWTASAARPPALAAARSATTAEWVLVPGPVGKGPLTGRFRAPCRGNYSNNTIAT